MHNYCSRLGPALLGFAMTANVSASSVTGQISVNLTLTDACQVNGAGTGAGTGINFGTLSFGSETSLFTSAIGEVLSSGGGALSILCSSGTSPTVTVRTGSNDGGSLGGTRALADGSGHFVPYDLYTDAGRTTLLAIDGVIPLATSTGVAQTVNIYGKALGKASLPAGAYTDTVSVELAF
ncbi:spore coat U domain-containing protein [Pseudomonas zeae]|uniref:Csu type fimbrial protein n=1 Tax=Pseudomonas zeae TaxID=2745510 RepID=UPI0039E1A9E5